jgi:quercetin dioxygenase-like cupin family protein
MVPPTTLQLQEDMMRITTAITSTIGIGAAFATAAVLALGTPSGAQGKPKPITAEPLTQRHTFTDDVSIRIVQRLEGLPRQVVEFDDASNLVIVRFTIHPGVVFPWHTHPGTVLISIAEGDFVFVFAEDCIKREYSAGTALVDPGNTVHTAFNPSANNETVVIATLLGAPDKGALTVPVDEANGAALDEKCGIDRKAIASGHSAH